MLINLFSLFINSLNYSVIYCTILGIKRLTESNESLNLLINHNSNIVGLLTESDIIKVNNIQRLSDNA